MYHSTNTRTCKTKTYTRESVTALSSRERWHWTLSGAKAHVQIPSEYGISPDLVIRWEETRCERLEKQLGLRTLYPHRNTSAPTPHAGKEPYLLKDVEIKEVDQVRVGDITHIQIEQRNYYLCVVMDWDNRFVLGWSMGRKMDAGLCLQALEMALKSGRRPRIFNTDQGSQYSSEDWQSAIRAEGHTNQHEMVR